MRKLAVWLTDKPSNAVLAMVVAFPLAPPLSAAVLVQQCAVHGFTGALLRAALTVGAVAAAGLIVGAASLELAMFCALVLVLGLSIGAVLVRTGSTTLTVQISLLVALVAIGVLHGLGIEGPSLWQTLAANIRGALAAGSNPEIGEFVDNLLAMLHEIALSGFWLTTVIALYLGQNLRALLPDGNFADGRFRDLNLGRVMAATMIVSCLVFASLGTPMARGIAVCLLVAFFVQGLALMHWFVARRAGRHGVLIAAYVALFMPFVNAIALPAFSVLGYVDAWFRIRRQVPTTPNI